MLPNFQFSILNFQSKFKFQIISIFFLFLASILYFLSSATLVHAAPPNTIPAQANVKPSSNTNPDVPNNPHFATQSTIIEIMSAITCQLVGVDPTNPKQACLGIDSLSGKIGFLPKTGSPAEASAQTGGAIGAMGDMVSMLYTLPVHTGEYFQNLAQNFGVTKKVYAQQTGTGFDGLKPLLGLWTAFRNIVYLIFVIVFVVIGLAVMLRVKIDPRTVMTIQNQIPKIIVGILLVTFSYAISGFLIDMMYTTIYITGNVIASAETNPKMDPSIVSDVASSTDPFAAAESSVGLGAAWGAASNIEPTIVNLLRTGPGFLFSSIVGGVVGDFLLPSFDSIKNTKLLTPKQLLASKSLKSLAVKVGTNIKSLAGRLESKIGKLLPDLIPPTIPGGKLVATIVGDFIQGAAVGLFTWTFIIPPLATLIIFFILSLALFAALFRLWFTLLMAYVQILLDVVLAPFWIIGGIIPGSPISITGWLKSIGANLLAFPVVIVMFLLGKVFQDAMGNGSTTNFVPPLIGDRLSPDAIKGFISLGIVLITPNILNLLKAAFKAPKTDIGIGKAIGSGAGTVAAPFKTIMTGFTFLAGQKMAKNLPIIGKYLGEGGGREAPTQNKNTNSGPFSGGGGI